jgi:hypothetical protein
MLIVDPEIKDDTPPKNKNLKIEAPNSFNFLSISPLE